MCRVDILVGIMRHGIPAQALRPSSTSLEWDLLLYLLGMLRLLEGLIVGRDESHAMLLFHEEIHLSLVPNSLVQHYSLGNERQLAEYLACGIDHVPKFIHVDDSFGDFRFIGENRIYRPMLIDEFSRVDWADLWNTRRGVGTEKNAELEKGG